ncbi:TPA: P-loop NTPase fold protein [Legionella pneumophila]|nr:hypothetical protein [Legionella pneumophila]HAU1874391.1 hypothetical protein [Legionella pneumophila]HBD7079390.1 hypothetical protein [Legionella pneumophila]HCC0692344.1 hypothetical protein [Legionella pneumophila]
MSLKYIEEHIIAFLNTNKAEVLALYGKWGIGKTFLWNKITENKNFAPNYKKYSYVSLFGINSINELKTATIVNMENLGEQEKNWLGKSKTTKELYSLAKDLPIFKHYTPFADAYLHSTIKDMVICIDDIERKGKNLSSDELLGWISHLKESKNCKIVIIYNDEKLNDERFQELNEKVVDKRLSLTLSPLEICDIALSPLKENHSFLRDNIVQLNLTNIRIIKTIINFVEEINVLIEGRVEQETIQELYQRISLFCYCHFTINEHIPSLDFIIEFGKELPKMNVTHKDDSRMKSYLTFLRINDFHGAIDLDLIIAQGVRSGYFNKEKLVLEVKKANDEIIKNKKRNESRDIWKPFFESFENNEDEVISSLYKGYFDYKTNLAINEIDYILTILESLDAKKANEIREDYVKYLEEERMAITPENYHLFDQLSDAKLLECLNSLSLKLTAPVPFHEAISRIALNNSWSPEHEEALTKADEEEYIAFFKSLKGDPAKYIKAFRVFIKQDTENYKKIWQLFTGAMDKMKDTELNTLRLKRMGF